MVRQRPKQQQRRRLRKSHTSSNALGITLSYTALKVLVYLCTLLFLAVLFLVHRHVPTPEDILRTYETNHGRVRLPSRLRESFRHRKESSLRNYFGSSAPQQPQRIAIVLPFIGKGPPPYLGLFCSAAGGAASLVDLTSLHSSSAH